MVRPFRIEQERYSLSRRYGCTVKNEVSGGGTQSSYTLVPMFFQKIHLIHGAHEEDKLRENRSHASNCQMRLL